MTSALCPQYQKRVRFTSGRDRQEPDGQPLPTPSITISSQQQQQQQQQQQHQYFAQQHISLSQDSVFPSAYRSSSPDQSDASHHHHHDGFLPAPIGPPPQRISPILRHKSLPNRLDQPAGVEEELSWGVTTDSLQQQHQQQQMRRQLQQQQQLKLSPPHAHSPRQLNPATSSCPAPPVPYQHSVEEIHQLHQLQRHYHQQQQQRHHHQPHHQSAVTGGHGVRTSAGPHPLSLSQPGLDPTALGSYPAGQDNVVDMSGLDLQEQLLLYVQSQMSRQTSLAQHNPGMDASHSSTSSSYPSTPVKSPPGHLYNPVPQQSHSALPQRHASHQPQTPNRQPQTPSHQSQTPSHQPQTPSHSLQHKSPSASSLTRHHGPADKRPLCLGEDTDDDWEEGEESLV